MINNRPTTVNGCCVGRPQGVKAWRLKRGGPMREAAPKMQARDLQLYDWSRGRVTVTSKGTLDDEEDRGWTSSGQEDGEDTRGFLGR